MQSYRENKLSQKKGKGKETVQRKCKRKYKSN